MTPQEFITKFSPCTDGSDAATKHATMAEAWDACTRPDWLFWTLRRVRPLTKEQAVTLALIFARSCSHHNTDPRVAAAIGATQAWLDSPSEKNRAAAYAAADAAYAAARAAAAAADAATAAAADAARAAHAAYAAADAARAATYADAAHAAYATYAAARAASYASARATTLDLISLAKEAMKGD